MPLTIVLHIVRWEKQSGNMRLHLVLSSSYQSNHTITAYICTVWPWCFGWMEPVFAYAIYNNYLMIELAACSLYNF